MIALIIYVCSVFSFDHLCYKRYINLPGFVTENNIEQGGTSRPGMTTRARIGARYQPLRGPDFPRSKQTEAVLSEDPGELSHRDKPSGYHPERVDESRTHSSRYPP
ncbi:hypothetical protein LIER_02538 [Lithospermum erythrorhizon]|uniref:Uncharacterized protein n=1 Tax=Lithospermum erythrorhizon TaxID=34254 RepID=A0AAV3NPU4_LITER